MDEARRGQGSLPSGRGVVAVCVLVLLLCVAHQFLMASEYHAAVMGTGHEWAATVMADTPMRDPAPTMPIPLMGECPAVQAIVPLLFLLLLLLGIARQVCGWPAPRDAGARPRAPARHLLPPLPPSRRQALLQVFRI